MNDRGMKKWRPFNSVATPREILNLKETVPLPTLSNYEIEEFEELLKGSLYTHSEIETTYVENGRICTLKDYVTSLDPIAKSISFSQKKINFRQIISIRK